MPEGHARPEHVTLHAPHRHGKACAKKSRLAPEFVNTKQGTVELKVMRIFADETRALNA